MDIAKRLPDCPFVFHRGGKPIRSFTKAFKTACESVGLKGIVPHDMRRSAVRNLHRAGNDEHDCMEISGHKTRAIFDRYDIIDEDDQRRTLERQQGIQTPADRTGTQSHPDPAGWMIYHISSTKGLFLEERAT